MKTFYIHMIIFYNAITIFLHSLLLPWCYLFCSLINSQKWVTGQNLIFITRIKLNLVRVKDIAPRWSQNKPRKRNHANVYYLDGAPLRDIINFFTSIAVDSWWLCWYVLHIPWAFSTFTQKTPRFRKRRKLCFKKSIHVFYLHSVKFYIIEDIEFQKEIQEELQDKKLDHKNMSANVKMWKWCKKTY